MADAHTPGPWTVSGVSLDDGSISIAKDRIVIAYATNASSFGDFINATMNGRKDFGAADTAVTQFANARLIAAAPRLLAACRSALAAIKGREHDQFLRDAISEATGEAK